MVPTLAEQGMKDFEVVVWHGVYAPKGTPKPVIDKLVAALQAAVQDKQFKARIAELGAEAVSKDKATPDSLAKHLKAEIESGLMGSLQKRMTSEVLTDMVQLARTVLDEAGDNAKNVAAVLSAAAFEDTIRRMGSVFAGVMGKDDLPSVIDALKSKGTLVAPQLGIALGYLNFRNRALHANWDQIDRASVSSVLAFVEGLLLKHFQ